ncbi:unnamed protein product [Rotaria socialis]|uniref:Uncharacterized protein n=2 Tax=Rotaria socialis TaxID=392032 RepID=A0A820TH04_9BILA|nr:unnamed protein product [Rotaria socialis]CAF3776953.1 unnamed protein product [Rotaria socialis]CAF4216291.1 unnamed protein product [Rotaria socialis]CAF4465635.1 unnamed protein product [Rotaria socialis]
MNDSKEAMSGSDQMPPCEKSNDIKNKIDSNSIYSVLHNVIVEGKDEENRVDDSNVKLTPYPTLVQLKSSIDDENNDTSSIIEPPSIQPLENFIKKRTITIEGLKQLRIRMAKHVKNCKISNSVGNSAAIIGGILCFVFPPVGVPVLLAGSATSLGTSITENVIEKRLRTEYTELLKEDSLAMKVCESNLKDITAWLVTVYSLGYSVSKAGVNFLKLSEAIQAASTLGTWSELIGQLPSLANALATGAKTAGTISGKILGISVIISVADLIQTWISTNATLSSIDKDIGSLEQQLMELKRIVHIYHG